MSTIERQAPAPSATPARRPLRLDRVTFGVLVVAAGFSWFLQSVGVGIPWRLYPPTALLLVGVALLATVWSGRGRGGLIGLGVVLLLVSLAIGFGAQRYAAPAGNVVVAPTAEQFPVVSRLSAGNVTVDLTQHPLPPAGRLEVYLGAGNVTLKLPAGADARVLATVSTGQIVVDGEKKSDGTQLSWTGGPADGAVIVQLDVALGRLEVDHV